MNRELHLVTRNVTRRVRASSRHVGILVGFGGKPPPFAGSSSPRVVMDTKTTTTLFASDDGRFGCLPHAPFPGTGTWHAERWHEATKHEIREFERELGRAPECETCTAIRRNGASR